MTIREFRGSLQGQKLAFIGDGNNMANSLIVGCLTAGMDVAVACPNEYRPDAKVLEFAKEYGDHFTLTDDIYKAAEGADVLYTDVWASMGQEGEAEARKKAFAGYCIDKKLTDVAKSDVMVQHCLPAHRGEEIMADVFEEHANEIFEEAENRLHVQKAVMVKLMAK
jgi:ornithine carbamoyltransferase